MESLIVDAIVTQEFRRDGGYYTAKPNDYFWHLWKENKDMLKAQGFQCIKHIDSFIVKVPHDLYAKVPRIDYTGREAWTDLPDIKKSSFLKPYQVDHTKHLIAAFPSNNILDGSETGIGKTYCAVTVAIEYDKSIFVITPKSVKNQWRKAVKLTGVKCVDVMNYEALKFGRSKYLTIEDNGKKKWYQWHLPEDAIIVWDEAHRCKNQETQNSKMMLAAVRQGIPGIALSATIAESPQHLGAIGPFLGLFKPEEYYPWIMRHGMYFKQFRPGARPALVFSGSRFHLYKIHSQIYPDHGHRVTKKELLEKYPDMYPENLILAEAVEMESAGKIQKAIKRMQKELRALQRKKDKDVNAENPLTIRLRARQEVELLKVPTFVEMADDALEEGNSVIIFVSFTETLESLKKHLNTDCIIKGGQDENERQRCIDDFQSNKSRIIIANIQAGNVGIDLHDTLGGYPRLVLLSPSDRSVDLLQALGRAHRDGTRSPVVQKLIFAAGTVEEEVCDAVDTKLQNMGIINDGDLSWESLR